MSGPGGILGKSPKGFVVKIDPDEASIKETFNAGNGGFKRPHDVVVSKNGSEIYVVDLDHPLRIIKLVYGKSGDEDQAPKSLLEQITSMFDWLG